MIPAYPLMYFYPHWDEWYRELKDQWNWSSIISLFCEKHESIINTQRILGFNGMTTLGPNQDEHIEIDEEKFKLTLTHLLKEEPIDRRTFILAVHYAYALTNNEVLEKKTLWVYHIHSTEYLTNYMIEDFPETKVIGMVRDPRSNLERRYIGSFKNVDDSKLTKSDALLFRNRPYYFACKHVFLGLEIIKGVQLDRVRVIRHEDLALDVKRVMREVAEFLNINYEPCMLEVTFGGKIWWGDRIYGRKPINIVNPKILEKDWIKTLSPSETFVREGVLFDYFNKYGYSPMHYREDSSASRLRLLLLSLFPSSIEREILREYLSLSNHKAFLHACINECKDVTLAKNYKWNATYRLKFTYRDLHLYKDKWHKWGLHAALKYKKGLLLHYVFTTVYCTLRYIRYLGEVIITPHLFLKRYLLQLSRLKSRTRSEGILPDALGYSDTCHPEGLRQVKSDT